MTMPTAMDWLCSVCVCLLFLRNFISFVFYSTIYQISREDFSLVTLLPVQEGSEYRNFTNLKNWLNIIVVGNIVLSCKCLRYAEAWNRRIRSYKLRCLFVQLCSSMQPAMHVNSVTSDICLSTQIPCMESCPWAQT